MLIDLLGGTCPEFPVGQVGTTGDGAHQFSSQRADRRWKPLRLCKPI
jgi:hypothetical protein